MSWKKILNELSFRVSDGIPDLTNEQHLMKLYDVLKEHQWPVEARVELIKNLTESEEWWTKMSPEQQADYIKKHPKSQKAQDAKEKEKEDGEESGSEDKPEVSKLNKELTSDQQKTSDLRDIGEAGAGGQAASQGESRFCSAVDTLDEKEFKKKNKKVINERTSQFKSGEKINGKKRPDKADTEVLDALGYEKPYSDEAYEYLASREVWAEQELERIKAVPKPNVFTKESGFKKDEKAYLTWMRAAYDGALSTQEHINESDMDTSKPSQTIQSTTEIDNKVQADLEQKANDSNLSEEDRKYYQKELKSFKKFRKYHDTYVVGQDKNGRTYIVSVSNKKDSNLNDPQNNTTPAARFEVMKKSYGEKTAQTVTDAIDDGIKKVTTVADQTRKSSSQVEVDDDFAALAEAASPKRMKVMDTKATMVDAKTGKAPRYSSGKPARGAEFSCYLEDKGVSQEDYNKLSRAEKLKVMQQFMGDDDWHGENGTEVSYEPYSKIFIKVGEAMKGSRGYGKAFWEKNPKAEKAKQSNGAKQAEDIKRNEQESVKEAHQDVVDKVTNADKEQGFPKDGKNGPHTQAYVETVMNAMHYNTYIDMDDEDDNKILLQMGVRGAKASHIRGCLAEKSGYDIKNGDREGLKKHLKETCTIEAETGAIVINSKDKDGDKTRIADDTWRTAGTSQKVASGFGDDMKDCVKSKVDKDRSR